MSYVDTRAIDGEKLAATIDARRLRGPLTPNAPMDRLTWFRTGGPAELLFQPADPDDLSQFLRMLPAEVVVTVVGVGSNLLVRDGGLRGAVVRLSGKGFGKVEAREGDRLQAGTAAPDRRVAAAALEAGLGGFHFYHGIPGSIGGALRMNAGANGVETVDRVLEVHAIDRAGNRHVLSNADMGYSYRHSAAPEGLIFTHCVMQGEPEHRDTIRARMEEVQNHRETVQPVREKTGGSTFKNPADHSAWKLVDDAGCRGLRIGGAQVSPMHCNFLINTGNATAYDLELLGETVRSRVLRNSGVRLDWEIKRLGLFAEDPVEPFLGHLL